MKSATTLISIDRRGLFALSLLALTAVLLWLTFGPLAERNEVSAAGASAQTETTLGNPVTFRVFPPIVNIPEERMRDHGVYFIGSGLKPGTEIRISLIWGRSGIVNRLTSVLHRARNVREDTDEIPQANFAGAFVWGLARGFDPREGEDFIFYGEYDPITVTLSDDATGELLATTALIVCGKERAEPWCDAAQDIVPLGRPSRGDGS